MEKLYFAAAIAALAALMHLLIGRIDAASTLAAHAIGLSVAGAIVDLIRWGWRPNR